MENTREIHRKKKSMIYRMVGVLAVVLAAAVCYTATVFAWFSVSIVNTGSSITAASYGLKVGVRMNGNSNYIWETESPVSYVDTEFKVNLKDGKAKIVLELTPATETLFQFNWIMESETDGVTCKKNASPASANGIIDNSGNQFEIEIDTEAPNIQTATIRLSCVTSFTGNKASVVYVDQETNLSGNTNPGTENYIYFLRNNITLDEVLHFTGSGSISIILNGYELNVPGIQVDADTTRFVSISDGKLVINNQLIQDGSQMDLGEDVRLSLSGLTEESKPSPTEPEQQTEPPVEDGEPDVTEPESAPEETTIPAGENSVPESFPAESETDLLH